MDFMCNYNIVDYLVDFPRTFGLYWCIQIASFHSILSLHFDLFIPYNREIKK